MRKTRPPLVAVAAILDHITPKNVLCAILDPLKQPEAKTIGISASHFSEIQDGRLDPIIPKPNRVWPLRLSMTHVKFQGERTSTFRVITQIRFQTRWPSWWPSWIT